MKSTYLPGVSVGLIVLATLAGRASAGDDDEVLRDGQDLWRTCSSCHCVPDPRIPQDQDWLELTETTSCISGKYDKPRFRKALIAYLRSEKTIRPILIGEGFEPADDESSGEIRVPATAGSAYLKAERESVRGGSPPKIRLHWEASEDGRTLVLPGGRYRLIQYALYRSGEGKSRWSISGSSAEGCAELVIAPESTAVMDLRPEIRAHLSAKKSEKGYTLGFFMTNRDEVRLSLSRDGKLMNPAWVIRGAENKEVARGDFEVT